MKSRTLLWYSLSSSVLAWVIGGFEVALILRFRNSLVDVVALQMVAFLMLFVGFRSAGRWLKRGDARGLFRLGSFLQAAACAWLALAVPLAQSPWLLAPFFLLRGLADGVFAGGRSVTFLALVEDRDRDPWVLQLQALAVGLGLLLPPAAGALIAGMGAGTAAIPPGYLILALVAGTWALGCAFLAPRLEIPPQEIGWEGWLPLVRRPEHRPWLALLAVGCLSGVTASLAISSLNVAVVGGEWGLGLLAAWAAFLSGVFFWGLHRFARSTALKRLRWIGAGTSGEFVSRLVYAVWPTLPGLGFRSVVDNFVVPFRGLLGENIVRRQLEVAARNEGLSLAQVQYFQESIILLLRLGVSVVLILVLAWTGADAQRTCRFLLVACLPLGVVEFFLLRILDRRHQAQEA
jgi:hypothetical protein